MSGYVTSCFCFSDVIKYVFSPSGQAPEIITPLTDLYGEHGRSVTLECVITGNPRPEYRWYRGLREIAETSKYSIYEKGDTQVCPLSIPHAKSEFV